METQVLHWKHTKTFTFLIFYAYKSGMHASPRLTAKKEALPRPVKITETFEAQRGKVDFNPLKFGRKEGSNFVR